MTKGDRTPVNVELFPWDLQVPGGRDDLGGKVFVDVNQIDVVDRHASTVQSLLTGFNVARSSRVVSRLVQSSLRTLTPPGVVIGRSSRSKKPFCCERTARCWHKAANSSISTRLTCSTRRMFSAA